MRLDLVLKQSGLIKRRTVAKALADKGYILVNNKTSKPSTEIKENDIISLQLGHKVITVKIHFSIRYNRPFPFFEEISTENIYVES